jgi:O-antigen ligase
MTGIIVLMIFVANIVLSVAAPRAFIFLSLIIGEAPYGLVPSLERGGFLPSFGGFNMSAMVELSIMFGSLLVIGLNMQRGSSFISKCFPHVVFLLFAAAGVLWAQNPAYGVRMLAKFSAPLFFLLACTSCLRTRPDVKSFEKAIMWSAWLSLVLALSNYVFKYAPAFVSNKITFLTVPGSSGAVFSFHMSVAALLALGTYIYGKTRRHLFMTLLFSAAVFMAFTRISMVGLIIASSLLVMLSPGSKIVRLAFPLLVGCGFLILIFVNPTLKTRMFTDPGNVSAGAAASDPSSLLVHVHGSGRFEAWEIALNRFFYPNPIYGAGTGATQAWFYQGTRAHIGVLHSDYLRILCELGVVGLVLFGIAMIGYAGGLVKALRRNKLYDKKYSSVALACLLFYLITMATDNSLDYVLPFSNYLFCLVAISAFVERMRRVSPVQGRRPSSLSMA